jgi:hypothetical protein
LSIYSQEELDAIADSLNVRPRATHNWRTPLQVFAAALASSHQPDISIHQQPLHFTLESAPGFSKFNVIENGLFVIAHIELMGVFPMLLVQQ